MTSSLEFEGKTTEEAILKASLALNIPAEQLKFTLLTMGSKGFLGFGRKKAKIRIDEPMVQKDLPSSAPDQEVLASNKHHVKRTDSGFDKKTPAQKNEPPALCLGPVPPPVTCPGPDESIYDGPADEQMLTAQDILKSILDKMGMEAEISTYRIGKRIILNIESADSALLIGRRGNTLEALQFILNKIVSRRLGLNNYEHKEDNAEETLRLIVDVAGYRQRRHNYLIESTRTLAQEVLKNGRNQSLSHLNSAERKLIHLALKPVKGLITTSFGQGAIRDLIIKRKGR